MREKIEGRYARALGEAEIAGSSIEVRMLEVEKATIDAEGSQRLEEIRKSLGLEKAAGEPAAIEGAGSETS